MQMISGFYNFAFTNYSEVSNGVVVSSKQVESCGRYNCVPTWNLKYEYDVNGTPFYGSRVMLFRDNGEYKRVLNTYMEGVEVIINYNKKYPHYSILELPKLSEAPWGRLIFWLGSVFLVNWFFCALDRMRSWP
ncbi:hypothetical protein KUV95_17310 [Microbulbifer agarilyticus]|uniref:DUF3592 domain-containing protein n=1 Tax=Microbulbifer agarilyticus TaxID=260552 RepID=UPI001C95B264|nr:hypothetical protein [Microbulbifer agarilyticus]MBY6213303.1 hypothetical protein [Microbulbifer agarilyticus]